VSARGGGGRASGGCGLVGGGCFDLEGVLDFDLEEVMGFDSDASWLEDSSPFADSEVIVDDCVVGGSP
jgi:hypothetical protein